MEEPLSVRAGGEQWERNKSSFLLMVYIFFVRICKEGREWNLTCLGILGESICIRNFILLQAVLSQQENLGQKEVW